MENNKNNASYQKAGCMITTRILRSVVKSEFSDYLHSLGFKREKANDSSGLMYFFRRVLPERHDLVEIQFDQYHKPRFVIEFGSVPSDGIIDSYGRSLAAGKVRCYKLVENGRLYRSSFLLIKRWFRVSTFEARVFGAERAAHNEVQRAIKRFYQVEDWLSKRTTGTCIVISKNGHNEPSVAKQALVAKGAWPPDGWSGEP